jgi:hypothetical protein
MGPDGNIKKAKFLEIGDFLFQTDFIPKRAFKVKREMDDKVLNLIVKINSRIFGKETSQFDAVKECDSGIITAGGTIKIVIKDPLFSILEENANIAHPPGQLRGSCLDHNPPSPGFKLFMNHFIPHAKVSLTFLLLPFCDRTSISFLRKVFH